MYHFDADAAEHLHHKGNAKLQSQVRDPSPHRLLDPLTTHHHRPPLSRGNSRKGPAS